ncbi:TetR/AcrR family transcriptional regulator [Subtercola frigoramans]|uniref:AcrR family transcriptional regulator n=2 Tax=Subtercola frigoramans TaxID=120298 RepID=A0ABS2L9H8_9MICO|nr:AcrR family transcriptional regulator [Subtercola frigoramans]
MIPTPESSPREVIGLTATGPGSRGPYAKGQARRHRIIAAAFKAFGTVGYRNASMQQIADDCGVTRAGLLHHFPTKESLLEAVLDEREYLADQMFYKDGPPELEDGVEYFRRLLQVIEHNSRNPGIVSLFAVLSTEATDPAHPANAYFKARYERALSRVRDAITNLAERDLIREGIDPRGIEIDIIALADGLQVQWLLDPSTVDMPQRLRAFLQAIVTVQIP